MAVTQTAAEHNLLDQRLPLTPTRSRRALAVAATVVVAGLIVSSESFDPLPMAFVACGMVVAGFLIAAVAWARSAPVDRAEPTAWDYSGLLLFAGFALATALGSSWMTI